MSDYQPRKGDRVRVEFDGVVCCVSSSGRVHIGESGGTSTTYVLPEHLTPIEPEYEPGTWYWPAGLIPSRPIRRNTSGTWWLPGYGNLSHDVPARPLRRMTVEGDLS